MIILNNVSLPFDTDFSCLVGIVAKQLKTDTDNISSVSLYRRSVDARRKSDVHFCCSFLVGVKLKEESIIKKCKNASLFSQKEYSWKSCKKCPENHPVIIGFGPAGMFAALTLAKAGMKPIVFERGLDVDSRTAAVTEFFSGGKLDTSSNIQFGEGGAGTFSDGKLNTGIKDIRCKAVLNEFAKFGADSDILIDAKPHIGTDVLKTVVKNLRNEIIRLGGQVNFQSTLESLNTENGRIVSLTVNGIELPCDEVILAIGHSARDTFKMLKDKGINMQKKAFAMGVRIEHLQSDINKALYGDFAENKALSAADYKLATHLENGRGVFTFCMCPGGYVVNASSECGGIAVNGMSENARDGKNANSAVLVGVTPEDFSDDDVLAGCYLQESIERKAYGIADGKVPITTVGSFVYGKTAKLGKIKPTVKPDTVLCDISGIYPSFITESIKEGIKRFGRMIDGFDCDDAVITAPETRSSSPVRIVRNSDMQSLCVSGLYPAGEGAGYAGGIMSAAVDGIKVAEAIIDKYNE